VVDFVLLTTFTVPSSHTFPRGLELQPLWRVRVSHTNGKCDFPTEEHPGFSDTGAVAVGHFPKFSVLAQWTGCHHELEVGLERRISYHPPDSISSYDETEVIGRVGFEPANSRISNRRRNYSPSHGDSAPTPQSYCLEIWGKSQVIRD
jgi:hypothetical protein